MQKPKVRILLAGSSHTRLMFPYVRTFLDDISVVAKLPRDAGRSDEILAWIPEWPLEGQDLIHLYSGHRDLAFNEAGQPHVGPEQFKTNLERILTIMRRRSRARIVVSNIPPVAPGFETETDPDRNNRIQRYNGIIAEVAKQFGLPVHDFWSFISLQEGGQTKYIDGMHFTRRVYEAFARDLSDYLIAEANTKAP